MEKNDELVISKDESVCITYTFSLSGSHSPSFPTFSWNESKEYTKIPFLFVDNGFINNEKLEIDLITLIY